MKTIIDDAGRLEIPEEIRRQAGLQPGMQLEVRWQDGHIEIEPASVPVRLERRGPLLVAVPEVPVEPLTDQVVEEIRQALLYERGLGL